MKRAMKFNRGLMGRLLALLLTGPTLCAVGGDNAAKPDTGLPTLSLAIRCTSADLKAGDEIPIEFTITNRGTNDYKHADRTYDRGGRMPEYRLMATNDSGEAVPDPRAHDKGFRMGGGIFQYAVVRPGESFKKIIPLNRWAVVKEGGRYVVVGTYLADQYSTNHGGLSSDPITIAVQPRTEEEMDAYISSLTNQVVSDGLAMKLMYTCSPKIVPTLLRMMYEPGHGSFWESEALLFYVPRSEEIKREIIAMATKRGLANGTQYILSGYGYDREELQPLIERSLAPDNPQAWVAGALAAQYFAKDELAPRLIALATEPQSAARSQAIYALAANRTEEGVKVLKALLNDPDANIRKTTGNAIRTAYIWRGIWKGRPLKPEDFDEKYQKPK